MNEKFVIELQLKGDKEVLQALSLAENSINNVVRGTGEINNNFRIMRNVVAQAFNAVRSIGSLMQQMSQFGLGRFVSAFESTLVSRATGMFTSQLDNAIERFDIMKTFPTMMEHFGISTNASAAALKKMNEAVIGLPTSLSEIVELSQRFVSVMPAMGLSGDELMSKASDFAIAINNAFLAGGNTSQQAYFAMMQLQDLFTKGELTDREWKSLGTGLQGAGLKIAERLGYQNFIELGEAFNNGDIELEKLVDTIIELGSPGGILSQMANTYKMRLSSVFANIGNAFQRLIAGSMVEDEEGNIIFTGGILGTLDQLVAERFADNEDINDLASFIRANIIPRIDDLGAQLSEWIIEHQDEIFGFFDRLIAYDWEGLTAKIADFLALKWNVLITLLEKIPPGLMAFSSTLAGPAGQALVTFANLLEPLVLGGMWLHRFGAAGAGGAAGIAGAGGAAGAAGIGWATAGTTAALSALGVIGYEAYKQWNSANEAAETYYFTIDKLQREGLLDPEVLTTMKDEINPELENIHQQYDAYIEEYRQKYEHYRANKIGGPAKTYEEWLPFWARWKMNDYESAISAYETALTRIDNLNFMHTESWQTYKAEADKIGGIPEDLIKAFEEGSVEIPDTLDEFLSLITTWTGEVEKDVDIGFRSAMIKGKKQIDQGVQDMGTSLDDFEQSLRNERSTSWANAGSVLGNALGSAFFGSAWEWIQKIWDILNPPTDDSILEEYWSGGGGAAGGMKPMLKAYGGAVRIGSSALGNYHDTIPAMLSPGEYVLRKHAVDKIGLDFLNKLNNFNFSGALDSLTQRVGSGMSPYSFASATANNTRIYNNNAQANITVNNSSQEFTQRRASKWIRGLN